MFTPIQQFLERVAVPGSPRRIRREAARILSQATGIALSAEQVEYRDGVVRIIAQPLVRGEILLKKNTLLSLLRAELPSIVDLQ